MIAVATSLPEALTVLAEAAEVGGEEGLPAGPLGMVMGMGLGLTAGLIILALEHANKDHADSKPGAVEECPPTAAEDADEDIECFKRPPHVSMREFERNVKMAEDEINKSSPDEFLERLKELEEKGARVIRNEPENRAAMMAAWNFWKKILSKDLAEAMPHLADVLLEDFPKAPLSPEEARGSVEREWGGDKLTRFHDMAHRQDTGGGGPPDVFGGPVDASINRSIGPQWGAKLAGLRKKAEKAKRAGKQKMDVELKVCPEEAK